MLHHCSVAELHRHVEPESVDIILTDPPYPKEFLPCWRELAEFASYALKPGGHLFAMSGKAWLPQVFDSFSGVVGIRYNWTICMGPLTQGNAPCIGRRVKGSCWKPILWYVKPPSVVSEQTRDLVSPSGADKRFHKWGQGGSEWVGILDSLKRPKPALIVDPFVGGGTTAVIAVREGYEFIGADIDSDCIEITEQRLATRQEYLFT